MLQGATETLDSFWTEITVWGKVEKFY